METQVSTTTNPKWMTILGWVLGILPSLMMLFSASMMFLMPPEVVEGFTHLGWDPKLAYIIVILKIGCVLIYLIPRTSVLGAILLAGYLGGAIATHVRIGDPFISSSFTIIILAVFFWLGLWLREPRLRRLLPFR